jgi:hypothetical protein
LNQLYGHISQPSPWRQGKFLQRNRRPNVFGLILKVAPVGKSTIVERRKTNPTLLAAVLYRPHLYSDEPQPTSPQVPAFSENPRRLKLWDPAQPTRDLPVLPGHHFFTGNVAPDFYWERLNRSRPQTKSESDKIGGI